MVAATLSIALGHAHIRDGEKGYIFALGNPYPISDEGINIDEWLNGTSPRFVREFSSEFPFTEVYDFLDKEQEAHNLAEMMIVHIRDPGSKRTQNALSTLRLKTPCMSARTMIRMLEILCDLESGQ